MTEFVSMTSIDGRIEPTETAAVPVMDRGFLYGDSIYEVFRTHDGVPLLYEEHWTRFRNSASLIHLDLQFTREAVFDEIRRTVARSGAADVPCDVYVRYVVTRGEGPLGLMPDARTPQRLIVMVKRVPQWNADFYSNGVHLAVAQTRRNDVNTLDPNIKGGNYLNNVMGVIEAGRLGADDCLMLDAAGLITEASNSNVFLVRDGVIRTPSQLSANLKGTTKRSVVDLCVQAGIEVGEAELTLDDLLTAEECFLTSATREVMPVRSVNCGDGQQSQFPAGGGPLTRRLAALYKAYVADYVAGHTEYSLFG